jgi:hypothetical protein
MSLSKNNGAKIA